MKALSGVWLTAALLLAAALMLLASSELSRVSGSIPRAVLWATCLLLVCQLALDLLRIRGGEKAEEPDRRTARERAAVAWILALLFGVWLLGVVAGSALFCLAWMRWHAGERWPAAVALAAGVGAMLWMVFGYLPGPGLYIGLLGRLVS